MRLGLMRAVCGCALCFVVVWLAAAGPAGADVGAMPGIPPSDVSGHHPLPSSGQLGSSASSQTSTGGATGGAGATTQPTQPPLITTTKHCTWSRRHHRGRRTCKFLRGTTLIKKCVKKPHHRSKCRVFNTARAAIDGPRVAAKIAGTKVATGFRQTEEPAVVRIYWNCSNPGDGTTCNVCSGSMIRNGLVLTAGHCVYSNKPDGYDHDHTGFIGYYNASTYFVVPGNTWQNGRPTAPYGVWTVRRMWTTYDYGTNNYLGPDWGIIELAPHADGKYPGDVGIGHFDATWNQPTVEELYSTGYPRDGAFWGAQYGVGNFQYFCDDVWSPQSDGHVDPAYGAAYYGMSVDPCEETGGASGGPVFTNVDGGWTIIGVNNRGPAANARGFGTEMLSFYFNDKFGSFWNSVLSQVQSGV